MNDGSPNWWHDLSRRMSRRIGFVMREREMNKLAPVMEREFRRSGLSDWQSFLTELDIRSPRSPIWQSLLNHILIPETSLFRHNQQWDFFRRIVLGENDRPLKIWSAACSTGEEPFTVAMAALGDGRSNVEIWGTDISMASLTIASRGHVMLRPGKPEPLASKWLRRKGNGWEMDRQVRALIRWEWANLVDCQDLIRKHGPFDVILCRNVLLYFHEDAVNYVLQQFEHALRPDGWLLLGHAESLLFRQTSFRMVEGGLGYTRRAIKDSVQAAPKPRTPAEKDERRVEPSRLVDAATALEGRDKQSEAAALLKTGLRNDDGDMLIHLCLSGLYRRTGQLDDAAKELSLLARRIASRSDDDLVPGGDGLTVGALRQVVAPYVAREAS